MIGIIEMVDVHTACSGESLWYDPVCAGDSGMCVGRLH